MPHLSPDGPSSSTNLLFDSFQPEALVHFRGCAKRIKLAFGYPQSMHIKRDMHACRCAGAGPWRGSHTRHVCSMMYPPVHKVRQVEARPAKAYIGQYSHRGDLFVAAYQDSHVRVFDTSGYAPFSRFVDAIQGTAYASMAAFIRRISQHCVRQKDCHGKLAACCALFLQTGNRRLMTVY